MEKRELCCISLKTCDCVSVWDLKLYRINCVFYIVVNQCIDRIKQTFRADQLNWLFLLSINLRFVRAMVKVICLTA